MEACLCHVVFSLSRGEKMTEWKKERRQNDNLSFSSRKQKINDRTKRRQNLDKKTQFSDFVLSFFCLFTPHSFAFSPTSLWLLEYLLFSFFCPANLLRVTAFSYSPNKTRYTLWSRSLINALASRGCPLYTGDIFTPKLIISVLGGTKWRKS